jgi:F-type H+-transporting ATPase subunit delta
MRLIIRYAEGFLEYAKTSIGFEKALEELKKAKDVFRANPEFESFLENPSINYYDKCDCLDKTLTGAFTEEMRNFLKLLLKKGRIEKFASIAEYARIKYSHGERIKALLNTSYMIDETLMGKLKDKMEAKLRSKLQLYVDLEPQMLGGVKLTVGNRIWDGSVRKRLEDLKRKLLAAKVV